MSCFQSSEQVSQEEFAPRGGATRDTGQPPAVDPLILQTSWGCEEKTQQTGDSVEESHGHRQLWLRSARCFVFLTTVPLLRNKCELGQHETQ